MENYLQALRDTPLPSILAIGGILFLLLSVLQKAGTQIETKPGKERFTIIIGFALLLSGVSLYLLPQTPENSVSSNNSNLTPDGTGFPIESFHITGMRFSSSCISTDYNLLTLDMQQASMTGIPVYDGCGLSFQDITVSSPEVPNAYKAKVEFFANNTLIGTTEEKYLDRTATVFDTIAPLESPYDGGYYIWKVPSGWGKIEARLSYYQEGDNKTYLDTVNIKLNRSGTAYLIKPPILKIQSISLTVNNGPSQTFYPGDQKRELPVVVGDKVIITTLIYKAYSIIPDTKIRSYLIKWIVSSSGSYSNSTESFTTQYQAIQSSFQEITGFPWTLTVEANNSLGIYLERDDGSYADYVRINFVYK